jgi:hypothetical protein
MRADQGNHRLHEGHGEGEDEGEVTKLYYHAAEIIPRTADRQGLAPACRGAASRAAITSASATRSRTCTGDRGNDRSNDRSGRHRHVPADADAPTDFVSPSREFALKL